MKSRLERIYGTYVRTYSSRFTNNSNSFEPREKWKERTKKVPYQYHYQYSLVHCTTGSTGRGIIPHYYHIITILLFR